MAVGAERLMSMLKLSALPLAAFMGAAIWGAAAIDVLPIIQTSQK